MRPERSTPRLTLPSAYPNDYKGWGFWDPVAHKEIIFNGSPIVSPPLHPHPRPYEPLVPQSVEVRLCLLLLTMTLWMLCLRLASSRVPS